MTDEPVVPRRRNLWQRWRRDRAFAIGIALVAAGFLMMGVAWWGTARTFFIPSQIAYLVSGGVLGVATVATGLTVVVAHLLRVATARRSLQLRLLTGEMRSLVDVALHQGRSSVGGETS